MSARLLLRQISYGSMITSYLDTVQSDEDKTEALQALVQLFNSMADVTSRVIVTAVGARRSLYLQDMAFKNKATESKLQNLSTIGSDLFLRKYFDVLHSSAESIRDAKETQHLRGKDNYAASKKRKFVQRGDARLNEASASKVPKRTGSKGTENRNFKKRNNYHDKSAAAPKKSDNNQLGFRAPKY